MLRPSYRRGGPASHPGRAIAAAFAIAILTGTALLSVPFATTSGERAPLLDALFTSTSAVCVTGLVTVDTGSYWSDYGRAVILVLIQAGGLGIMTMASLVALLFSRRLGYRIRLITQAEAKALSAADIRRLIWRIVTFSAICESFVAGVLFVRFVTAYDESVGGALYSATFHAVSAFNNAGFGLYSDSLVRYVADPVVSITISAAVIVGGLGFPVVFELLRSWRHPSSWSILTRITVTVTSLLLTVGTLGVLAGEGRNSETLGRLSAGDAVVASFFTAVMPRTAGFNSIDIAALRPETLLLTDALMFIGGGSAGTAGGIKVTTLGLLIFVAWAEIRGRRDVEVGWRRVPVHNQRQALVVALLGLSTVTVTTLALLAITVFPTDQVLFEVVSAFATVGLSTGITPELPRSAQLILTAVMFLGRIGPLTLFAGLAQRQSHRLRTLPEERMIVG